MTKFRDAAIIIWLLMNIVPQAQAWYRLQVDMHYEIYAVDAGIWE